MSQIIAVKGSPTLIPSKCFPDSITLIYYFGKRAISGRKECGYKAAERKLGAGPVGSLVPENTNDQDLGQVLTLSHS